MPDVTASYGRPFDFNAFLGIFMNYWRVFMTKVLYLHQTFTVFIVLMRLYLTCLCLDHKKRFISFFVFYSFKNTLFINLFILQFPLNHLQIYTQMHSVLLHSSSIWQKILQNRDQNSAVFEWSAFLFFVFLLFSLY